MNTSIRRTLTRNLSDDYPYVKRMAPWRDKYIGDPVSIWIVESIWKWRWITPTSITLLSFAVAVVSCYCFILGDIYLVVGGVLWELAYWLDCVDGKLARKTGAITKHGAWLDRNLDRVKRVGAMACLACSFDGSTMLLVAIYILIAMGRRVPCKHNPWLDAWRKRHGILSTFDPLDETLVLFTLGPILQAPLASAILCLCFQIAGKSIYLLEFKTPGVDNLATSDVK